MDFQVGDRVKISLDMEGSFYNQEIKDRWRNQTGTVKSIEPDSLLRVVMDDKKRFTAHGVHLYCRWCTKLDPQMALIFPG